MPLPTATSPAPAATRTRPLVWLGWMAILCLLAYFIARNVLHYFVFTEESYGTYFWPKASWLFPHVFCGLLAAVLGPLQFWPRIRRDHLTFHRISGRIYVAGVAVGAVAGIGMALKISSTDIAYAFGLMALAGAWMLTTAMAFVAIRRKNLVQHKQWMIRSYVVTFAFVTFRLVEKVLQRGNLVAEHELSAMLAWACWAVPLLVTEVLIQSRSIFTSNRAVGVKQ